MRGRDNATPTPPLDFFFGGLPTTAAQLGTNETSARTTAVLTFDGGIPIWAPTNKTWSPWGN